MTERRSRRAAGPLVSAAAVLALTGCAADYVGDDWQCPLAQGKVCASVAAADPAVPETRVPETLVPGTLVPGTRGTANQVHDVPLYRRIDGRIAAGAPAGRVDEPVCQSDCDPFAWLAGLFAGPADSESGKTGRTDAARNADIEAAGTDVSRRDGDAAIVAEVGPGGNPAADALGATRDAADAAVHPVSHASGADSPTVLSAVSGDASPPATDKAAGDAGSDEALDAVVDDALRTGEVVARIWIAPFVDADGIYREGAWVRAVIAPAAWRLP